MPNNDQTNHPLPAQRCAPRRLAEGRVAAVDMCVCGTMHLHFGALTLRMDQATLTELLATLGQAVAVCSARPREASGDPSDPRYVVNGRGEA